MLKQKYVKTIPNIGLLVTVTCYQYGTWIITRGPKNIEQLTWYSASFKFKMYQKTGSNFVVIFGLKEFVILNAVLDTEIKY